MPTPAAARAELAELRARLREAEETITAIRTGGIDTVLAGPPGREQLNSVSSADRAYRLIVQSMSEGAATVAPNGLVIEANPQLTAMTGRTAEELAGLNVREIVTHPAGPGFEDLSAVKPGQTARAEGELAGPDGGVPVTIAVSAFDLDGMVLRCMVFTDLSGRRAAEAELAADAYHNRSLIDASADLLFTVDRQGRVADVNAATAEATGCQRDELIGTSVTAYFSRPDDFRSALERVLACGSVRDFGTELRVRGGGVTPLLCNAAVYRDAAGEPAGIVVSGRDVSQIQASEAALQRSEELLRAAAAYNMSLIEASPDPLVTIDRDGRLTDVNAAVERATGYRRGELIGTEFAGYFTDPPRARAGYRQVFRDGSVRDYPLELRQRDGTSIPVLYNASVYRDPAGQVTGVFAAARDVSEVRKAEAALRESEQRLNAIVENAPVGIVEHMPDMRIALTNRYYADMTGYDEAELLAMPPRGVVHPDDRAADVAATERLLSGAASSYTEQRRFVRKNGSVGWMQQSRSVIRDADGRPLRIITAGRDVTEQLSTEQALRESEAELRAIVDNAPVGIAELSIDGQVLRTNAYYARMLRGEAAGLAGQPASAFVHPDDRAADAEAVARLLAGTDSYEQVRRYVRADQTTGWLKVSRAVIRDAGGAPLRLISTGRDITEERASQEALRESGERLQAIVHAAPVGIDELDPSGLLISGNPRFFEIVGYPAAGLIGRPLSDIVHADDRAADREHTRQLLAGDVPSYTAEKRFVHSDGSVVWAEVSRALVRAPDGSPERIIGVVRDITEQRQAEAEVLELNADLEHRVEQRTAELERANKNMEAFSYSVSHDLRAPLRALSGFSEALIDDYADALGETGREYAQRIVAASERMGMLIDDLLHLSRVSRAEMNVRPVDLSAEATAIGDELRRRDPGRTVRLTVQGGVWVLADAALARSVVQNLLENAWKFTGKRDDAAIEFGAQAEPDGMLDCYVRDNGAGFDPEYGAKLFQPFQRLHAVTDFPGTGIGLASVRRIVERHGGRAWAEGAPGAGATFHVTLPAADPVPEGLAGGSGE